MIRVILVDDHPVFLSGLARVLDAQPDVTVVGTAYDGRVALSMIDQLRPDVAILDAKMPVLDGVTLLRVAKERHPDLKSLFISGYIDDITVGQAIEAGARGFIVKSVPPEEIYAALKRVADGGTALPLESHRALAAKVAEIGVTKPSDGLTERELQTLQLVVDGHSSVSIGERLSISEATVKTHLAHIYAKLGVEGRPSAITEAIRRGLVRL